MLGELLWEAADLDRALAELDEGDGGRSRATCGARRTLALIYAAKGDTADLAAELERVQELAPEDLEVQARSRLGLSAHGRQRKRRSPPMKTCSRSSPGTCRRSRSLGDCYRRHKEPEKAIAAYQKVHEARAGRSAALFPSRRRLSRKRATTTERSGVPGRAAVQALPRRGLDQPRARSRSVAAICRRRTGTCRARWCARRRGPRRTTTTRWCCRRRRSATGRSTSSK